MFFAVRSILNKWGILDILADIFLQVFNIFYGYQVIQLKGYVKNLGPIILRQPKYCFINFGQDLFMIKEQKFDAHTQIGRTMISIRD